MGSHAVVVVGCSCCGRPRFTKQTYWNRQFGQWHPVRELNWRQIGLLWVTIMVCGKGVGEIFVCGVLDSGSFFFNILIQDIIQAFWVFYLYKLYMIGLPWLWDTACMSFSTRKHSLKKIVSRTPLPPHNGHLSTTAFFCPQGGRCGEVWLYRQFPFLVDLLQVDLLVSGASLVWPRSGRPRATKSREVDLSRLMAMYFHFHFRKGLIKINSEAIRLLRTNSSATSFNSRKTSTTSKNAFALEVALTIS